jgi:hypothetical protein
MKRILTACTIALVMGLICSLAYGEEANSNDNWEFGLAPMYLWAVSINGDQTVEGMDVDLDIPFSDIFDNLNGALIFHFEGLYKQKWGFLADLNYIDIEPSESTPIGDIDIDFTEILLEFAGFYRITRGAHHFDWYGGLRYSSMDIGMDLPGVLPKFDQREDWVDPFLGLRWQWKIGEKWATILRGDIGGFGVGSDITWNFVGLVDFKPWKHVSLFGGYRVLYQDYSTGSGSSEFAFDATMHGPVLGMNIAW